MRYSTISAVGAFTALSSATADYLRLDPSRCAGGEDAPLRTNVEPIAGGDGVFILPPFDDAQIITLAGDLIITSATTDAGYFTAQDTLLASLKTALATLKGARGNLVHAGGTLHVWKYGAIDSSYQGALKAVTFSVIVDVT